MIALSEDDTYAIYLYADGFMQWTTGDIRGGVSGLGGAGALVGANRMDRGNGVDFSLPSSQTCSIIHMPSRSNVNVPGMFVLRASERKPHFGKIKS